MAEYEQVDGLGAAAGFGPAEFTDDMQLNVVFDLPEKKIGELRIYTGEEFDGKATLQQLRPIAEKLIAGYTSK